MALELVAAIVGAFGMAGIALALRKLSSGRLPRWIMPAFAAIGLIGVTIVLEYGWADRVSGELPPGVSVVQTEATPSPLRPWTFVVPLVTRLVAIDGRNLATHPAVPTLRLAPVYIFARWRSPEQGLMAFDCAAGGQVLLTRGVEITDAGDLVGADWQPAAAGDALQAAACAGGGQNGS